MRTAVPSGSRVAVFMAQSIHDAMHITALQYNPRYLEVQDNLDTVDALIASLDTDLLVDGHRRCPWSFLFDCRS